MDKTKKEYNNDEQVGFMKSLARLVSDGILTVEGAAARSGLTVSEFKEKAGIE